MFARRGLLRFQGQLDFGTGSNDDGLGVALGFADDVAAAFDVVQLFAHHALGISGFDG